MSSLNPLQNQTRVHSPTILQLHVLQEGGCDNFRVFLFQRLESFQEFELLFHYSFGIKPHDLSTVKAFTAISKLRLSPFDQVI